jgi:hypothetical protein
MPIVRKDCTKMAILEISVKQYLVKKQHLSTLKQAARITGSVIEDGP